MRSHVARAVRHLRLYNGWRQRDLGDRAGVSRELISRLERGEVSSLSLRTLGRVANALGAVLDVRLRWRGEQLDRLLDARHAAVQAAVTGSLTNAGWAARVEVSFNHYGDRGRVDVLAFHQATRLLLIVEVKTAIGDIQETLGRLDVKTRLGPVLARESGWERPSAAVPALVVADSRAVRRVVLEHAPLFSRYSIRGRSALAWIRQPAGPPPSGLLWYAIGPDSRRATVNSALRVRSRPGSHGT
jgi:transcriptional regulator with XRE-family HTH domain